MSKRARDAGLAIQSGGADGSGLQWYETLAGAVDGGVFHLDADDAIVAVDETIVDHTGYERSDLLGEPASRLFESSELARVGRRLDDALADDGGLVVTRDLALRTADDGTIPCSARLRPLTIDGERGGTIGIVRERSDESTARPADTDDAPDRTDRSPEIPTSGPVRSVLDEADVGVFVLDEAFEVAWINETTEEYFGVDRPAVLGRDKRELIDETIQGRIEDGHTFAETVLETYDDNTYVEEFECHVTPGDDREERWLEHRSKPIESGPYAGGRLELYYDVTDRHRHATQLRRLNEAFREWLDGGSRESIASRASRHLVDVLGLEINGVFLHDDETGALEPAAASDRARSLFDGLPTFEPGEGIAWEVFDSGEPEIYDDVRRDSSVYNPETPIRSEIVLPVGDHGVVVAGSERRAAFDDGDLTLAKLAASSLEVTFDRRRHEQRLERERAQTGKLLETAPIAIAVEDADGEIVMANQHARRAMGQEGRETPVASDLFAEGQLTDASGTPIEPGDGPAATVRETGDPVLDEEIAVERPDGTRRWFSVNAAPLFGPDGCLDRVVVAGEDVTTLKRQERRLERRTDELETELGEIFGRVSDAFYALDEEWRFTHVNERARELLDRSEAELLGERIWDAFPEAADSDLREQFERAMESQESVSFERQFEPLDIWAQINVHPSETGLSVYFRDVTERKERERRLEQYEQIVETIEDGVYVLDEDRTFVMANDAFVAMTRYSRDELLGTHASAVFGEEFDRLEAEKLDWNRRSTSPSFEEELRTATGDWITVESRFTVLPTDEGTDHRVGVARDVTERTERERELAKYETIIETMEDGVYALDADGRFTTVNEAYVEMTGYSREELLGSHGSLVVDESVMDLARSVAAGEAEQSAIETEIETKSGETIAIEATVTRATTLDDERERVGVVRDVTERKERQRKLEASEQRYRTLAENFPNGVVALFDDDLRYTAAGGQLMDDLGIDRETVIGQSIEERYPDDLFEEIEPHFRAALDGEERSFEVTYYGRDLLAYTLPIEPAGEAYRGMLVVRDVTERKQYQRQLEASNERLEQFAYAASHDLQEPLRMVSSYLQLIQRRYGEELDEDGREFIDYAVDGAERMREMIDGLLEYSRVETRGDPFETVALDDVVDDVRTDLQLQIEETDAEIEAESLPAVHGDGGQLRQVFQNLLSNAIEYSGDEPPRIEITAERRETPRAPERDGATENEGNEWIVSVRDDGVGIDPEESDRIFEVFQRLHSHEEHEGTGIGLALCRRIVERHGGEIWVDSDPGDGATFSFTLPAAE